MPDLGLDVLLKGNNMIRLLQGMWGSTANQSHFYCNQHAAWDSCWSTDDNEK